MTGIDYFIQAHTLVTYAVIFFGMLVEGEGIILFASVFAWEGLLSWYILGIVVILGTILGDVLWYVAGHALKNTRLGVWLDTRYERTGDWVYENVVSRYATYAIISKFMYFTTRPTIFLAGWHDFPFKKFLKITSYATVIWALVILGIGYFFGYTVHVIGFKKIMHRVEFFAVGLFLAVFLLEHLLKRFVFKKHAKRAITPRA